jgi:hypothetical protein
MRLALSGLESGRQCDCRKFQECVRRSSSLTIGSEKRGVDFRWGQDKIRGVNIGGWLVLEP